MRFCVLASGSRGNCIYVESQNTRLLVDCGLSRKETRRRLALAGIECDRLDGILLSHEHSDHAGGVGIASRSFAAPVHCTRLAYRPIESRLGPLSGLVEFQAGSPFEIGGLSIEPFSLPHDAADTVGFVISDGQTRLGIATDLGQRTELAGTRLGGCQALVLESNHDPRMLEDGPYPWPLKQRISGRLGHLSNGESAAFLASLLHSSLRYVVLAHLSETNNLPDIARAAARQVLKAAGAEEDVDLSLGCQGEPGALHTL
ncbi:MAG: MBL fold metallo-hydrolase [Pseudomonadota bacterium]